MQNISCSVVSGYFNARIYFERMGKVALIIKKNITLLTVKN